MFDNKEPKPLSEEDIRKIHMIPKVSHKISEEIKELDMDKYLVLKWEDIKKVRMVGTAREMFKEINIQRTIEGKPQNQYLVLNLQDNIDLDYFGDHLFGDEFDDNQEIKVCDIAVPLVNAILKER